MGKCLKHPFGQAVLVLLISYLLLDFGIEYIPPLFGMVSAPIPNSVLLQYLVTVGVGILLWVSDNDARWAEFKAPMHRVMVDPDRKVARNSLMVLVPILVAFATFNQVMPSVAAPASLRSIHPVCGVRSNSGSGDVLQPCGSGIRSCLPAKGREKLKVNQRPQKKIEIFGS